MSTEVNTFKRSEWAANHRSGELQGKMWPEGQPLGYINSIMLALTRWETREVICERCKKECSHIELDTMEWCIVCTKEVLQEILDELKGKVKNAE